MSVSRQRGAALLLMLVLAGSALAITMIFTLQKRNYATERERKTIEALNKAKAALLAWTLTQPGNSSTAPDPGSLPCPDMDNAPGSPNEGTRTNCKAGVVGLFPWRTLKSERLVDGWGEPLWYAFDPAFVDTATNTPRINSDSRAGLQIFDTSGTLLTPAGSEAAAVIFSAGPALTGQTRPANARTGAGNYLESTPFGNNAATGGPFVAGPDANGSLNDRLVYISGQELIAQISIRAAAEVTAALQAHYQDQGKYPNPAAWIAGSSCFTNEWSSSSSCPSNPGRCRGVLPAPDTLQVDNWKGAGKFPLWFINNLWHRSIYYSVREAGCDPTVDGKAVDAVFLMPGAPLDSIVRVAKPASIKSKVSTDLADYLEDARNRDADDAFFSPGAASNDRLYVCEQGNNGPICREKKR